MRNLNEILKDFEVNAANPSKLFEEYLAEGKKVVGLAPAYAPKEIVHAMGLVPMGVWGADIELKNAKQYFPAFITSILQSILELGTLGTYKGMSALMVPALTDSLKTLGQNWKYAVPSIPFIPVTYPQNRRSSGGRAFLLANYKKMIAALEQATGAKFDESKLNASLEIYNKQNALMREVSDVVAKNTGITASQRSDIFKSAHFMTVEKHIALVEEFLQAIKETPVVKEGKVAIITSGLLADNKDLLNIFDENNLHIVSDDICYESRQYITDAKITGTGLENLAQKFIDLDYCSMLFDVEKVRVKLIMENLKKYNAKGVVVLLTKFSDSEEFDYVYIKRACAEAGVPQILVEVDRQMNNYEQAKTLIQSFGEMLSI